MNKIKLFTLTFFLLLVGSITVSAADIVLPDLISNHMLIQQVKPIKLWGSATPGETVTITLESATKVYSSGATTVKADGTFSAELPGVLAGGPFTLTFDSPSSKKIVKDVLVGELWVQGGQSNMAKTVGASGVYLTEIRPKETKDKIRIFMNTETITTTQPATDLKGSWNVVNSNSANSYSAVGYVALEKLNEELNLPVGGICNAIGGAGMNQFMGPSSGSVGSYYYGKTSPLTNMNIRGVMWYQGEGDRDRTEADFSSTFNKLIKSWRDDWNDPDMPFVYVMLPPSPMKYYASWTGNYIMEDFSTARLGQLKSYYENDNVAFAVSMDCPPNSGEDPLHPNNKRPIGERLALAALDEIYQVTDKGMSPLYKSVTLSGNTAVITFSNTYDGLKTTDQKDPRCFMAAGSDGKFHEATAKITGKDMVTITCSEVSDIKQISYAVEKHMYPYTSSADAVIDTYADVNLTNSEGLPLCPFSYSVTMVKAEKQPLFTVVEDADRTVALNDTYLLPETITVKKGQSEQQASILWSSDFINTKKEKINKYMGYFTELDIFLPYTVTVKSLVEAPLFETVTAEKTIEGQLKVTATGQEMSQADRNLYLFISFFQADGTFISANSVPCIVKKRETPQIHASVLIPQGAAKVKIMPMNLQLRPWLPVTEKEINR